MIKQLQLQLLENIKAKEKTCAHKLFVEMNKYRGKIAEIKRIRKKIRLVTQCWKKRAMDKWVGEIENTAKELKCQTKYKVPSLKNEKIFSVCANLIGKHLTELKYCMLGDESYDSI